MRTLSLYSGAGGLDLGFERAGAHIVTACERDSHAAATLQAAFPKTIIHRDVINLVPTLREGDYGLIIGGPPCQGWSVAGKMQLDDPRSKHVWVFLEAVERVRPKIFVMENVDAIAVLGKWKKAREDILNRVSDLGYATYMTVLNANDFGVPQNRKRMFLFGILGTSNETVQVRLSMLLDAQRRPGGTVREVLTTLGAAGSQGNPITSNAIITYARRPIMRSTAYAGNLFNGAGRPLKLDAPAPTIAASAGGNKTHIVDEMEINGEPSFAKEYHAWLKQDGEIRVGIAPGRLRRLTIAESAAFQGFPADYPWQGPRSSVYRQIGNAVPVGLGEVVGRVTRVMHLLPV